MTRKLAYIRYKGFSGTNESVLRQLVRVFPEYEVEDIDLADLIPRRSFLQMRNLLHIIHEYPNVFWEKGRTLAWTKWVTSFMFRTIKKQIAATLLPRDDYAFTLQTQSLFDAQVPGLPHFVYTDHTLLANLDYHQQENSRIDIFSKQWRKMEPDIYANADAVFTMSDNVSNSLVRYYGYPEERIARVGVGCNAYRDGILPDISGRTVADYSGKRILFVGVLWKLKGGPELVEAFRILRRKHPDAKLTIVGCSPGIDEPGVEVLGRIPLSEVSAQYERASVFCMPSKGDAFGIVYLEAQMNGLPVVTLDIGAPPDFVTNGHNGFRVPPGDVQALADHLDTLVSDPQLCFDMGRRGREIVESSYTWDHVGDRMREEIMERAFPGTGDAAADRRRP